MRERNSFDDAVLNNERLLLSKVAAGDESAFGSLFNLHRKWVYNYALKIIKSREQAEEIMIDAFLKIWQHKNAAEIEHLEHYLRTITRNLTISALRRHNLEVTVNHELGKVWTEANNITEEDILLKDTTQIFNEALKSLTPQQQLIYTLCHVEGLKYSEVAKRLSISPLTVKTHMQHALRTLRTYINNSQSYTGLVIILLEMAITRK